LRGRTGASETAALIAAWFDNSTELTLLEMRVEEVGDRSHNSFRFAGVEEGEPYVFEQHLYCRVSEGKIDGGDLLCSGFRPSTASVVDRPGLGRTGDPERLGRWRTIADRRLAA
jgi:hypothetical protein